MSRLVSVLVAMLVAVPAFAAKKQINQDSYKKAGSFYGRSDGLYQENTSRGLVPVNNGMPSGVLGPSYRETFAYGDNKGLTCEDQSGMGACGGNTTLVPCLCTTGGGFKFISIPLVTADTPPDMDADSLDIASDQTDNDGLILLTGVGGASGRPFVIGDDPAFYMCTDVEVADITGIDQNIMAGFMKVGINEAWNADFEARYTYAGIGVLGTEAAGVTLEDVTIKTELENAGVSSTDTTDNATEGVRYKYCTYVSATGVVTYTFNGAAPTTTAAFTFPDGVEVVPFITFLHTNDVAGEIDLRLWEVGYTE